MPGSDDVLVHLDCHVVEALGDAEVVEQGPATPEGDPSTMPRVENGRSVRRQGSSHRRRASRR